MPKITRYQGNLKAFASEQLGTERTLFGEQNFADDLTSQFTPEFLRGWGIVGPSDNPSLNDFNAAMYTNGMLSAYLHQMGVAEYDPQQEYYVDSITTSGGSLYISLVNANNGNDPATSPEQWRPFLTSVPEATTTVKGIVELATTAEAVAGVSETLAVTPSGLDAAIAATSNDGFNRPIASLASAATVNLTTGAPTTSQLTITGDAAINGFTVASGRSFVVKFTGSPTLVNGASLVTGVGANIAVSPGDSCEIRATSANTVEVIQYIAADAKKRLATAYANFNGDGAVAVRDGHNIAGITDLGVGLYRANFSLPMDNNGYSAVGSAGALAAQGNIITMVSTFNYTISGVSMTVASGPGSGAGVSIQLTDLPQVSLIIFGGKS